MDHSIGGYLRRRSLKELEMILDMCENNREEYGYLENIVLEVLFEKRHESAAKAQNQPE